MGAGGGAFSTNHAGGGGCCEVTLSAADCPSSLTITIGSGGTLGVAGGDTTVTNGSSLTLKGKGGGSQYESYVGGLMEINGATIKDPGLKGGDGGSGSDKDAFLGGASGNGTSVLGGAGNGGFPGGGGKYLGTTTGGNGKVVIYALRGWHPAKYNCYRDWETKAEIDTLIAGNDLVAGALYEITGVHPTLYDDEIGRASCRERV